MSGNENDTNNGVDYSQHIVGHRGAGNAAPPNTMAALEKAVELGLEWVEFDVHLTEDKQLVVAHEGDLSKLMGSDVKVGENTYETLHEIDLARSFKGARGEQHMPRFEEVLEFCIENNLRTQIELKATGDQATELAEAVVEVLGQDEYAFAPGKQPLISSFQPDALKAVNEASNGTLETGLLIHTHENGQWKELADDVQPTFVHFYGGAFEEGIRLPKKFGDDVRAAGYKLNAFKVNTPEDAKAAVEAGAERFTSDEPEKLLGITPTLAQRNYRDTTLDTVVIPVGGYGTRMGEITKAIPKAMLPIGGKPLIMHAVDEALEAGVSRIIIPCRPEDKELFEKQFFGSEGRRAIIQQNKRDELLDGGNAFKDVVEVVPIYAKEGPASTIAQLVEERGIKNFGVILPDDLIVGETGALAQMLKSFRKTGVTTIGARQVEEREESSNVTFVKMEKRDDGVSITTTVQIKPKKDDPVSKSATAGRYIFTADYVDVVDAIDKEGLKEVSMSAVVRHYATHRTLAQMGNDVSMISEVEASKRGDERQVVFDNKAEFQGSMNYEGVGVVELSGATFYDCGDMYGYLTATAAFIPREIMREQFLLQNKNVTIMEAKLTVDAGQENGHDEDAHDALLKKEATANGHDVEETELDEDDLHADGEYHHQADDLDEDTHDVPGVV